MARRDRPIMHSDVRKAAAATAGAYSGYTIGSRYPHAVMSFGAWVLALILAVPLVALLFVLGPMVMFFAYPATVAVAFLAPGLAARRTTWSMGRGYSWFRWLVKPFLIASSFVWTFVALGVMGGMNTQGMLLGIPIIMAILIVVPAWLLRRQDRRIRPAAIPMGLQPEGGVQ